MFETDQSAEIQCEEGVMVEVSPMPHLVTCSRKSGRQITHIGGGTAGQPWLINVVSAMAGIEDGTWIFYIAVGGQVGPLIVARKSNGEKLLKTPFDGEEPRSLLSLPDCPPDWGRLW